MADPLDFSDSIAAANRERSARTETRGSIRVTDGVIPVFYTKEIQDMAASEAAGRPIYRSEPWIEIIVPGSRDKVTMPVRPDHKARFPEQWESFERGDAHQIADGTPIVEWQAIPRTRAMELRAQGFFTVEQLADAGDNQLQRAGGDARRLQEQAKAFVSGQRELDRERELRAEIEAKFADMVARNEELARRVADLTRKLETEADESDDIAGRAGSRARGRHRPAE
jgi:hypothetical protein